jgi:hypothetical protein
MMIINLNYLEINIKNLMILYKLDLNETIKIKKEYKRQYHI